MISNAVAQDWLPVEQLAALPIPAAVLYQCQLVVSEACTNAVRQAHKNLPRETPIDLEITVFNDRLEIKIWDRGKPFDFQAKLKEKMAIKKSVGVGIKDLGFMLQFKAVL